MVHGVEGFVNGQQVAAVDCLGARLVKPLVHIPNKKELVDFFEKCSHETLLNSLK